MSLCQTDRAQFQEHFADEMSEPAIRFAASDVDDPLAKDRRVDQRVAPEGVRKPRIRPVQFAQGFRGI